MAMVSIRQEEDHGTRMAKNAYIDRTNEWYGYKETGLKWLEEKGYKFEKICAEQGDLILWDSRAAHYNRSPTTDQVRMGEPSSSRLEMIRLRRSTFSHLCLHGACLYGYPGGVDQETRSFLKYVSPQSD